LEGTGKVWVAMGTEIFMAVGALHEEFQRFLLQFDRDSS